MSNVIQLDKNTRLRLLLTKAAEAARGVADTIKDPERRERLVQRADEIAAKARAL